MTQPTEQTLSDAGKCQKPEDFNFFDSGKGKFRRVLLKHSKSRKGPFAPLLGDSSIELVQSIDRNDCRKIF